jgi:hypothetical protein
MTGANTGVKGIFGRVIRAPLLVKAGAACGIVAGVTLGFMLSAAAGVVLGVVFGGTIGIVAGVVMDRDEKRSSHRTRVLDDIIGVTSGSLGRTRAISSIPPPPEVDREQELESWVTEWLTPGPPQVG